MIQLGPSGGSGGNEFTDPLSASMLEVRVRHGAYIDNIEIAWSDGTTTSHGGNGGNGPDIFDLTNDPIISIQGSVSGTENGGPYIGSIQFSTFSGRKSPVYGTQYSAQFFYGPFNGLVAPGTISGFWGRAGGYLDAIGVFV